MQEPSRDATSLPRVSSFRMCVRVALRIDLIGFDRIFVADQ